MRVYYHDNKPGDQRWPHDSGVQVADEELARLGVFAACAQPQDKVDEVAQTRGYAARDVVHVTPDAFESLAAYERTLRTFYEEHIHEDEEIRYILQGRGYFDVRDQDDRWVRCRVEAGDLLILPAGIYHRFTLDETNCIKAMRLFRTDPKWTPLNRPCDSNAYRQTYLASLRA